MKLYFNPSVCSLAPHIALREAGIKFELVKVDIRAHTVADGSDYYKINPKGYVPVLQLDNGEYLTEGSVISEYIADLNPAANLVPPVGTMARVRLREWMAFISTEIHKGFGPLFNPKMTDELKDMTRAKLASRLDWTVEQLGEKTYLMGETFTIADAYLFTVLGWGKWTGVDISKWPSLVSYCERIAQRPHVAGAMAAEAAA
jgi:glutathione S-transferase